MPVKCLSLDADTLRARRSIVDLTQVNSLPANMRMAAASGGLRNVATELLTQGQSCLPLNMGRQSAASMFFNGGGDHSVSSRGSPAFGCGPVPQVAMNQWGGMVEQNGDRSRFRELAQGQRHL